MTATLTPVLSRLPPTERRFLRLQAVEQKTGIRHTTIYLLMKHGGFPQNIRIGRRAMVWDSLEIDRWMDERIAERDAHEETLTPGR